MKRFAKHVLPLAAGALFAVGLSAGAQAVAGRIFTIESVTKGRTPGRVYTGREWRTGGELLRVGVTVREEVDARTVYARAYFFDRERRRIQKLTGPTKIQYGETYRGLLPEAFEPNKVYNIFFPIAEELSTGKNGWAVAVIVFGDEREAIASVFPANTFDLAALDFDEKSLALRSVVVSPPAPPEPRTMTPAP
ncbi:MAG: hypothetical protein JXB04_02055 [Kiritimatiellae bacterium]|nr:hypothetical protein [Kiritimatiellia bacterium]